MPDEKKTTELDRLEIFRGLIHDLSSRFDDVKVTIETMRSESVSSHAETRAETRSAISELVARIGSVSAEVDSLRHDYGRKVDALEREVGTLRREVDRLRTVLDTDRSAVAKSIEDVSASVKRLIDEANEERRTESQAVATHVSRLEQSIAKAIGDTASKDDLRQTNQAIVMTNEALGAVVNALGLEGQVSLGRYVPQHEKPPVPTLQKIERAQIESVTTAKSSRLYQGLIAAALIAQAIMRFFDWLQHQ